MKTTKPLFVFIALTCMMLIACGNGNAGHQPAGSPNSTQIDKKLTGPWQAIGSSGGFTGNGFQLDFQTLVLNENGSFELLRNDSIIAQGKISLVKEKEMVLCSFIFEKTANVQLALDPEKYIQVTHTDTMNLVAPCCDRYNIKLARKK